MAFKTEQELLETALNSAQLNEIVGADFSSTRLREPRGLFGVPDVVVTNLDCRAGVWICLETVALEMKLRNWRRALIQAFRYRSFAHAVYVVLDRDYARSALANLDKFERSNIGVITVDAEGSLYVHSQPSPSTPFCENLTARFSKVVFETLDSQDFA